ncbi:MAG: hypothetical protein EXR27_15110 [Betaproteobacteria bacterium]|nr:hypothetical protein [Betaproteobacteria bacterium]
MQTTRSRFVLVALVACIFAVVMAVFLNYFKYKTTITQIVQSRILVIGAGIENSVQSSLGLGMSFAELGTLTGLMEREKLADPLIRSIVVFDSTGRILYSTDQPQVGKDVPPPWIQAASLSKREWHVDEQAQGVAGIVLRNNFDLPVGYLALRYSRDQLLANIGAMGGRLLLVAGGVFAVVGLLLSLALIVVLRRFERDAAAMENGVRNLDTRVSAGSAGFSTAVEQLREAIGSAEAGIRDVQKKLDMRQAKT